MEIKVNELDVFLGNTKKNDEDLYLVNMTRSMFLDRPEIIEKYFKNEEGYACYNPRVVLDKATYESEIAGFKKQPKDKNNLKFETASSYYKRKVLQNVLNKDFGTYVNMAGYEYKPELCRYNNFWSHFVYDEDNFRDAEDKVIVSKQMCLDYELFEELHKVLFKAVRKNLVMLLNLENTIYVLNSIRETIVNTGFCTETQLNTMHKIKNDLTKVLESQEVKDWLETGVNDYIVFGTDETTKSDYIRTYQKVLRGITASRPNEDMSDFECFIGQNDLSSEISSNEDFEIESFQSNLDYNEEELD